MKYLLFAVFVALGSAVTAQEGPVTVPYDGSFDDATFAVEEMIIKRGLVIDHVSHVGAMLNRTAADVGSDKKIFDNAQVFTFCSAVLSRQVMEIDPLNIGECPYGVFVTERAGRVEIGHRAYPQGPMQVVEKMLAEIVAEAAGN